MDQAVKGEAFVIAKAGKPLVKGGGAGRPGGAAAAGLPGGEIAVPDDFDRMGESEIAALFGAGG